MTTNCDRNRTNNGTYGSSSSASSDAPTSTIRPFRANDSVELRAVATIWLASNLDAHPFVAPEFWRDALPTVETAFRTAEIFVATDPNDGAIRGFVGLDGTRVLGLFVDAAFRSRGIGAKLVAFCRTIRDELSANVYSKNERAVRFYRRERFEFVAERLDAATGAQEWTVVWKASKRFDVSGSKRSGQPVRDPEN